MYFTKILKQIILVYEKSSFVEFHRWIDIFYLVAEIENVKGVIVSYLFSLLASYRGIGSKSFPFTSKLACESCIQQKKENQLLIN